MHTASMTNASNFQLAHIIEHTLLRADATAADIGRLCQEAVFYGFFAVCVNPAHIDTCRRALNGTKVRVVTVVDFPLGSGLQHVRAQETRECITQGADEIDVVARISWAKEGDFACIEDDLCGIVDAAQARPVKVILETALLSDAQKVEVTRVAMRAGVSFVKTSTGYAAMGATVQDIKLLRSVTGESIGVKASGGIKSRAQALELVAAGASRIGSSQSIVLVEG